MLDKSFYHAFHKEVFHTPGNSFSSLNEALYSSTMKYGLQQLLRYADRNSMAHSREVRLPFLSHELVEFLFSLPDTMKMNQGWTKWIMRESFDILPPEIRWRLDKIGFEPPQKGWMERPEVIEKIRQGKEKLFSQHFISANCLRQKISGEDMSANTHGSWNLFMGAQLI